MTPQPALKVTVEGDLPDDVLDKIISAVQAAVRREVAQIDLLRDFVEGDDIPSLTGNGDIGGLVYWPPNKSSS